MPALLTRMSMRPPKTDVACSASAREASALPSSSAITKSARPPRERMPSTTCAPRWALRPEMTTCAPSAANASAIARPMLLVAPVTRAVLACSRPAMNCSHALSYPGDMSRTALSVIRPAARGHPDPARCSLSVAEESQRLCHEQVMVLEDAAVAGVRVDAELGVGQQLGEVERADRRQHRVVVAVDDQDGLVHVCQAGGRGALLPLREGGDRGADRLLGYRGVAVRGGVVRAGEEGVGRRPAGRGRREEQEVLGVLALGARLLQGSLEYGPRGRGPPGPRRWR